MNDSPTPPRATYRLQLHPDFGFHDAAELAPYLRDLGISHLYLSPCLQAASGSTHGYDVVDPSSFNRELGGEEGFQSLCEKLESLGLGLVMDLVPNHMAIVGKENPWWWDVLENGPTSLYARYFDVDWEASEERWPNKVLLPVLGNHYGRVLEAGEIDLIHQEGEFTVRYFEKAFPVAPFSLAEMLLRAARTCGSDLLAFLARCQERFASYPILGTDAIEQRHRDRRVLRKMLRDLCRETPEVSEAIDEEVARYRRDADRLDHLLELQNYRLAFWRTASRDLGYRRFFDIKDLAGLRVEQEEVFHATHDLIFRWIRRGTIDGLRIDHPDGLRDPHQYFHRLREACPETWIVAEKILQPEEKMPEDWPLAGTTGYDFLNLMGKVLVDPSGERELTAVYESLTGETTTFDQCVLEGKRWVLSDQFGSELKRLSSLMVDICENHRRHRDYTQHQLYEALLEIAVHFQVYRSYVRLKDKRVRSEDERHVFAAIRRATKNRPDLDPELFRFLKEILLLRVPGELEGELAVRFQQLSSAAMAKGMEDTAFYRYHRLVALNEVGGDPGTFAASAETFHQWCRETLEQHPATMLASTTHDTKRSEDVRARLILLSEIPERWGETVRRWAARNDRHRRKGIPDRNTEYLIYQTLVGTWPIGPDRMIPYMEKAIREAKTHTRWTKQNEEYENGVRDFVENILDDQSFCQEIEAFVEPLLFPGRVHGLAQTVLKLTAPGIPDFYQGTELWDLSLVDPDNRRPVDFLRRRQQLEQLATLTPAEILECMDEGLPKLFVMHKTLQLRKTHPEWFHEAGSYRPVQVAGESKDGVLAYLRGKAAMTVVPRWRMQDPSRWRGTVVESPGGTWRHLFTDQKFTDPKIPLDAVFAEFPVALLVREEGMGENR